MPSNAPHLHRSLTPIAPRRYPFRNETLPWELLDGPEHRALAVEAVTKTTVLLKNNNMLPLKPPASIAVVGPFARCADGLCYAHDYAGTPSFTTDFVDGLTTAGLAHGVKSVTYAQGSNDTCATRCASRGPLFNRSIWEQCDPTAASEAAIAEAVELVAAAEVTVLALGLGEKVEGEGCDRPNMTLPMVQQRLYDAVTAAAAKAGRRVILVLVSAAGVDVDESPVDAVLWQPYGGQVRGSLGPACAHGLRWSNRHLVSGPFSRFP